MYATAVRPRASDGTYRLQSGYAAFDKGPGSRYVSTGNVFSDCQSSGQIRAFNNIVMPMGEPCEPGHLRTWDLDNFTKMGLPGAIRRWIENRTEHREVVLYKFFHYEGSRYDAEQIVHGYVVTDGYNGPVIGIFPVRRGATVSRNKSLAALTYCARILMPEGGTYLPEPEHLV